MIRRYQKTYPNYPSPARQDTRAQGGWKKCSKCKQTFRVSGFGVDKSKRDGLHPNCRSCQAASRSEYFSRPEVRERNKQTSRQWKKDNPGQYKRSVRNARLKKEYGITLEQYEEML